MIPTMLLRGAKGGSGTFKQTPDNLRSEDTFEAVLGMGVGPMKGPVRGLKSIKLDGTAIENETGENNFGEFIATVGTGDPAAFPQPIELKLGAGGTPTQINLALTNKNQNSPGEWVTRTLNNTNANFIDFRYIVNQLFRQDKKGIFPNTLTLEIQMKPTGSGNWINPSIGTPSGTYKEQGFLLPGIGGAIMKTMLPHSYFDLQGNWTNSKPNYGITGKTQSPSVYELRIGVPNEGAYANVSWDLRTRLIEIDSVDADPNFEKRTISWESASAVYSTVLGTHEDWRGSAWMQLYGKASDQLSGVPEVTSIWETKIVSVPPQTVYNPATRQYTGQIWDGSWSKSYTNDPAWCINDAISDALSGLALIAPGSYLNKWDALEVSKWCSTLVPDGKGGTQPRYSMNLAISEPQKAEEFIRYLAGAVGGLAWDEGDGQWRMKMDKPDVPVELFTLENIEGEFLYANTDVDTRYNDITGTFKNAEMDYRQDRVRLVDNASIALIGRKTLNVVLVGCTDRQEAMRRLKLRIRSTVNERRIVNFTTNRRGRNVNQLDLIMVADGDLAVMGQTTTGRATISPDDPSSVTFRDPIYLPSGTQYAFRYSVPNPDYKPVPTSQPTAATWNKPTIVRTKMLSTASSNYNQSTRTFQLNDGGLTGEDIPDYVPFAIEAPNLPAMPKLYRVTSVTKGDDGERIMISALEIDTGKWEAADNVAKSDTVFQDLRGKVPKPLPSPNGHVLYISTVPSETGVLTSLSGRWQRPAGASVSGFRVQHSVNGQTLVTEIDKTQIAEWELINPPPGTHHIEICTIDRMGNYSEPLTDDLIVATGPDQTTPSLGQLWATAKPLNPAVVYTKGMLVQDQGATWTYISDSIWNGTPPPTLPTESNAYWRQIKDAASVDFSVDNTNFTVSADANGNVDPSQFPKVGKGKISGAGGADASTQATWSITTNNCTATVDVDGTFQITAMGAGTNGFANLTATYNNMAQTKRITITKDINGGGGDSGAGSSTLTQFGTVPASQTSYPSDPATYTKVLPNANGQITGSASLYFDVNQPSKGTVYFSLSGKLVFRPSSGGPWTDMTGDTANSNSATATGYPEPDSTTGVLTIPSQFQSGLTPGTSYDFGVMLRKNAGNSGGVTPYGSATVKPAA